VFQGSEYDTNDTNEVGYSFHRQKNHNSLSFGVNLILICFL